MGDGVNMASPSSRYTLLIPTFNRSAHLRNLLGYLAARRFEYPVRVLDSSSGDALSQNRETVGRAGLDVIHEVYDPAISMHKKIELGLSSVASTYCSLCADDDILFTDQLSGLFDVLDADPALAVAHGYYLNVRIGPDFEIWHTDYSAPSIVVDDALRRIVQQMSNYQAIFYGIHRTQVMQAIRRPLDRVGSPWAKELLTSSLALIAGGAYRAPQYYMARSTSPSIATEGWHPHQFLAMKPMELLREYAGYRAVLLEQLAADDRCQATHRPEQMERIFDLAHLKYFAPMLSPVIIDYIIERSLRPDTTSQEIVDGIWNTFVPPSESVTNRRNTLGTATPLDPLHPRRTYRHLRRLGRLYGTLRFEAKFDVSLSSSLDRISVKRHTRGGHPRRYLFSPAFLNEKLADGGQVTASHLQTIINHLDDYA
jgi:glycosyltransferase domain-containing protein